MFALTRFYVYTELTCDMYYPKRNKLHLEHSESLKTRTYLIICVFILLHSRVIPMMITLN